MKTILVRDSKGRVYGAGKASRNGVMMTIGSITNPPSVVEKVPCRTCPAMVACRCSKTPAGKILWPRVLPSCARCAKRSKQPVRRARKNWVLPAITGGAQAGLILGAAKKAYQIITNRPRKARNNFSTGKQYTESRKLISQIEITPKLQTAIDRYHEFHCGCKNPGGCNTKPSHVRIFDYEDGSDKITEQAMFSVGIAEIDINTVEDKNGKEIEIKPLKIGAVYRVPDDHISNKAQSQWVHSFREDGGKPPIHAVDPQTGIMMQLGGTYQVRDWIRR